MIEGTARTFWAVTLNRKVGLLSRMESQGLWLGSRPAPIAVPWRPRILRLRPRVHKRRLVGRSGRFELFNGF